MSPDFTMIGDRGARWPVSGYYNVLEWSWRWCTWSVDRCRASTVWRGWHHLYVHTLLVNPPTTAEIEQRVQHISPTAVALWHSYHLQRRVYTERKTRPLLTVIHGYIVSGKHNNTFTVDAQFVQTTYKVKKASHSHGRMFLNRFFGLSSTCWAKSKAAPDWSGIVYNKTLQLKACT